MYADMLFKGALVLAHSLRDNGTRKQLAALVTLDTIQPSTIDELKVGLSYNGDEKELIIATDLVRSRNTSRAHRQQIAREPLPDEPT